MTEPSRLAGRGCPIRGARRIAWVRQHMPILRRLETEFSVSRPFDGLRVVVCVHLESKTAYLAKVLTAGGASVAVCGSNPQSTNDDAAAALHADGLRVYAAHGIDRPTLLEHMRLALATSPHVVIDDGGDLVEILHEEMAAQLPGVLGVCEETTSGVRRASERHQRGELRCPVVLVNDARCKTLFDNVHGTGQSVWDAIMRTTNLVVAGTSVVILGFGYCGRGIALRAKGLGARVTVCEIDPIKAADAAMHGYHVAPAAQACGKADVIITATGAEHVIDSALAGHIRSGALLANAGHFENEIDTVQLRQQARSISSPRANIETLTFEHDRVLHLLGGGHIVNIACGDGHPAQIMDVSFALQALAAQYVVAQSDQFLPAPIPLPDEIDQEVARRKLAAMNLSCDAAPAGVNLDPQV